MKLSETSIRRPVLASMLSAALVLFGVIGYTRLSVRELPDIGPPVMSGSRQLPGAHAQVVERAATAAARLVKAGLQSLAGVGSAAVFGERRFAMRAWVQPDELSARGLTVQDVESAITARNVEIPAGRIESTRREFSVRSLGELKTPREFGEMVVTSQGGQVVKLKDVAHVELGPEDTRSIFRYNGIPASIVATFAIMYFLGFSINNFTLLALTIAIGIVVDDAIIVLENAYRHQEELHEAPERAAVNGTNEIGFAVIATTIALVAVFTPLGFLRGSTGRLLSEFGIAVAGAVVISGFVALTLTPMLCAKVLRVPHEHGAVFKVFERGFNAIADRYAGLLRRAVDHRAVVLGGTLVVVALSVVVFLVFPPTRLQNELIPDDDRGFFLVVVRGPEGASLPYTDGYVRQVEQIIGRTPDGNG